MRDPLREQVETARVHHVGESVRAASLAESLRLAGAVARGGVPARCETCGQTTYWWLDRRHPDLPWRCAICTPQPERPARGARK